MVRVDSHVKVVMEMDVKEAQELVDILSVAEGGWAHWEALSSALKQLKKAGK